MAEDQGKQEEKFDFTREGEALGYISLDQARVRAIQHARDNTGFYGPRYSGVTFVWEVLSQEETEDYYEIRLSFRPSGRFRGEPGVEQFTINKVNGDVEIRQILDEPSSPDLPPVPDQPPADPVTPVTPTPPETDQEAVRVQPPPAEEVPVPDRPATPAEEVPVPDRPAAPAEEVPTPDRPATPAEEVPVPDRPAAPAEEITTPDQPATPAEETRTPDRPAGTVTPVLPSRPERPPTPEPPVGTRRRPSKSAAVGLSGLAAVIAVVVLLASGVCNGEDTGDGGSGGAGPFATETPFPTASPASTATTAPAVAPFATATSVPAGAPRATVTSVPERGPAPFLGVAIPTTARESSLPWEAGGESLTPLRPMFEFLLGVDRFTGELVPMLADSWEVGPDSTVWTFELNGGVQFHHGWGQFTVEDVAHSVEMVLRAPTPAGEYWRSTLDGMEQIDDRTLNFVLNRPDPLFQRRVSELGDLVMLSWSQWDEQGDQGLVDSGPVGTGPYSFLDREIGNRIEFQRVEDHWRRTPEFEEMAIWQVPEMGARVAGVQAGELDIAPVDLDHYFSGLEGGVQGVFSTQPALELVYFFPDLYREDTDRFRFDNPFEDPRVREAFARAIDRDLINEALFRGIGSTAHVLACHPFDPCFEPRWEADFPDLYGYDPDRARQLLDEAGFLDGFAVDLNYYRHEGLMDLRELTEAISAMAADVGFEPIPIGYGGFTLNQGLPAGLVRYGMFGLPIASRQMIDAVGTFNYTWQEGELLAMERIDLDQLYEESLEQPTLEDLTALERAAGDFKFYNYLELPLFWLPATVLLNQGTVADYVFPGTISGQISHLEYVEAVR